MTVQEAHNHYKSLTDQIRAKYEQLDSGEFETVDTTAFKAEACELYRPQSSSTEDTFQF